MKQSSHNENKISNLEGCEIIMDVELEEKRIANPFENHDNLQIKANVNSKRKNEIMKENFKKLHVQINKWKGHNRNATCWAFYCVNDNKKIDVYSLLH
jgi:hypothetical protein